MELKVFINIFCNRYWVTEMHVDGFRFDLASVMTRGSRLSAKTICQIRNDVAQFVLGFNVFPVFFISFLLCQQSLGCS